MKRSYFKIAIISIALLLAGCSSLEELPSPSASASPAVRKVLESPLLEHAASLNSLAPDKNHASILSIGEEALLARLHLIRSARKSISIQTIIWINDEVGRLVMYELIQAAKRGVKVRLLIDHIASEQHPEIAAFLASVSPNLQVKLYNPVGLDPDSPRVDPSLVERFLTVLFRFDRVNHRMHNKTFIVDGMVAITGGRNYQNAYYDQARGLNYKDRDVLLVGPVVNEMEESFFDFWGFEHSIDLDDHVDIRELIDKGNLKMWETREDFRLNGFFDELDARAERREVIAELFVRSLTGVEQAYFIADEPGKNDQTSVGDFAGSGRITLELARLVSGAEESVYIQTPYLVLTSSGIELFEKLRKDKPDIDIRVHTNSLAATDSWYVYALSYKQKRTYLKDLKFRMYELKPLPGDIDSMMPRYGELRNRLMPHAEKKATMDTIKGGGSQGGVLQADEPYLCLHAKSMVIDDEISFIGSYNLDPRSENINTEVGVVIIDKGFAAMLKQDVRLDMLPHNSWVVAEKKVPLSLGQPNAVIEWFSDVFPLIDLWPVRYASSFELIEGREAVEPGHDDFYENFRDVGSFPMADEYRPGKELGARGTKAFLSFVKPLL